MLSENVKIVQVLAPVADFANGHPDTAVIGVGGFKWATFVVNMGVNTGGTGRITVTVKATDVNAKTHSDSVGHWYRVGTATTPGIESVALTRVEAGAEVSLAAAACATNQAVYEVDVEEARKELGDTGYTLNGLYLNVHEDVNDPVVGSVTCILSQARFQGGTHTGTIIA